MPMNRLNGALRALAQQATHTSGPVGSLLTTIGSFAVGSGPVAIALIGIAALAKGYELLTSKARAAAKEQKDLATSLGAMFKPSTGPDSDKAKAFNAALQERVRIAKELQQVEAAPISSPGFKEKRIAELTAEYQRLGKSIGYAMTGGVTMLDTVTTKTEKAITPLRTMQKVVEDIAFSWDDAARAILAMDNTISKTTLRAATGQLSQAFGPNAINPNGPQLTDFGTNVSGVDVNIGLTKEQIKTRDALIGNEDKNTQLMTSAIAQSAQVIGSSVAQALNIGGGGRGSNLGGALGSTAGFALGFAFGGGPIGGAIGSTIGSIAGSALGGLFDNNTKATNANTQATRENTAALMLNAPSGYKTAAGRFDATEIRTAHQRYLTRGGTPILGTV